MVTVHTLGHMQSYGYLVAIQPDTSTIVHVSQQLSAALGFCKHEEDKTNLLQYTRHG